MQVYIQAGERQHKEQDHARLVMLVLVLCSTFLSFFVFYFNDLGPLLCVKIKINSSSNRVYLLNGDHTENKSSCLKRKSYQTGLSAFKVADYFSTFKQPKRRIQTAAMFLRMYLWWSLCTLHLHACQVKLTVGDSGLCCCTCVTYLER